MANSVGAIAEPSSGARNCRPAELRHVGLAGLVEGGGGEDQDRGVDQQREHQRDGQSMVASVIACACRRCRRSAASARCPSADKLCGITVAPMIPARDRHIGILDDLDGRREAADHLPQSGSAMAIWMPKQTVMTEQRHHEGLDITEAELLHLQDRTRRARYSTPISSGMPNRRLSPIAVPITSARSVAQMANSASAQSGTAT